MWRTFPTTHGADHPLPANAALGDPDSVESPRTEPSEPRPALGSVTTPDFVGMTPQDARRTARFAELHLAVEERATDSGHRGRIFRQQPEPGARVQAGDTVMLLVGARPLVKVPDVSGLDEQEALNALRAAGFSPSKRVERRSNSVGVGHVIRTRPRAGSAEPVGTRVSYIVAVAPRPKRAQARRDAKRSRDRWSDAAFMSMPIGE